MFEIGAVEDASLSRSHAHFPQMKTILSRLLMLGTATALLGDVMESLPLYFV